MAYGRSYAASRGGFLSKLARSTVGRVAGAVIGATPLGQAYQRVRGALRPTQPTALQVSMPGGMPTLSMAGQGPGRPAPGITGALQRAVPGGASGFLKSRRMNAGNAKAARRAIRRIKSVRKLLQSIERELPRRPALKSAGVITRREAERALRS